jgi:membrane-associated phospholipid phosphatase
VFEVASFLTNTLSTPFLVLFAVIVAAVFAFGHRLDAVLLLLTFPLHVLAQFPKALVDRPRPSSEFPSIEGIGGFQSFPSGHAEYVISFYGFLAFLVAQGLDRRWQRALAVTACVGFVLTVGVGRVALGRHWPLDVIASYIAGAGILSGILWLRWSIRRAILDMDAEHPRRDSERENVSGDVDGR